MTDVDSPSEIWDFLVASGSLRPQDYDRGLLGVLLERSGITTEAFMVALLGAMEPYALMMAELGEFFERHDVKRTGEGLRMRFRFDDAKEELAFDLAHFREWIRVWEAVRATMEAIAWDISSLWDLSRCFDQAVSWDERRAGPREPSTREWVGRNTYPGREHAREHWASPLPPTPSPLGDPETDEWVTRLQSVLTDVARACAPYRDYETLRVAAPEERDKQRPPDDAAERATGLGAWAVRDLQLLESDYFAGSFASALWVWLEQLQRLPPDEIRATAQPVTDCAKVVFESRPRAVIETARLIETLGEFLDLPIWKRRHSLYQAWLIPVIEKALAAYPVEIHHVDGVLRLGFTETPVATFQTESGELSLVSERKVRMPRPKERKSRKENVQPDYALVTGDAPESTLVVIETKQYLRPSVANFAEALTDYGEAFPNAVVIVADYGPVTPRVLETVEPSVAPRARVIGDVRPLSTEALRDLQRTLAERVPPPPGGRIAVGAAVTGIDLVVVDISGSMDLELAAPRVLDGLRALAEANPQARWLAADTAIRFSGTGSGALDAVLELPRTSSTSLGYALVGEDLRNAAVVTDEDGQGEFLGGDGPRLLGVARGGTIEWQPAARPASP